MLPCSTGPTLVPHGSDSRAPRVRHPSKCKIATFRLGYINCLFILAFELFSNTSFPCLVLFVFHSCHRVVVRVTGRRIVRPRITPNIEVFRILNTIGNGHIIASVLVDRTLRELSFVHTRESIFTTELVKGSDACPFNTWILGDIKNSNLFCTVVHFYLTTYKSKISNGSEENF